LTKNAKNDKIIYIISISGCVIMKCIIKRTSLVFLSLFAVIFLLSGCGDKSENEVLKGKWVPISAVINGETVQYSELDLENGYFEFNFKGNGSCTATLAGIEYKGSYVFSGTSVDATLNGNSEKLSYESARQTLTYSYDNTTSFTFMKEQ
jgi:uncharacterized lipoprotein YehR (DUF1307 family)